MNFLINLFLALSSVVAFASEHAEHVEGSAEHIPWKNLIIPQTVNLLVLAVGLVYLLRNKVKSFFSDKYTSFETERKKAEEKRIHAERAQHEIKSKIDDMDKTSLQAVEKAKHEAAALKSNVLEHAKVAATKMQEEAKAMAMFERQRAITALKIELVKESVQVAATKLNQKTEKEVQQQLNSEFVNKVRGVQL